MIDHHQLPEPPFWYVVLLADELHISHADARTRAMQEMCQEKQAKQQEVKKRLEVKP